MLSEWTKERKIYRRINELSPVMWSEKDGRYKQQKDIWAELIKWGWIGVELLLQHIYRSQLRWSWVLPDWGDLRADPEHARDIMFLKWPVNSLVTTGRVGGGLFSCLDSRIWHKFNECCLCIRIITFPNSLAFEAKLSVPNEFLLKVCNSSLHQLKAASCL